MLEAPWPCTLIILTATKSESRAGGLRTPSSCISMSKSQPSPRDWLQKCQRKLDGTTLMDPHSWNRNGKPHKHSNTPYYLSCFKGHACLVCHQHTPPSFFLFSFSQWLSCCEPTLTRVHSHRNTLSAISHHSGAHSTHPATTGCAHHGESRKALPFRVPFGWETGPSHDLGPFYLQ